MLSKFNEEKEECEQTGEGLTGLANLGNTSIMNKSMPMIMNARAISLLTKVSSAMLYLIVHGLRCIYNIAFVDIRWLDY